MESYNVFCYADDLILTSLSVTGLQSLIDVSRDYITSHGLNFNPSKTACTTFGTTHQVVKPTWILNGIKLKQDNAITYRCGTIINHMLYVDDICIVSLSSSGFQQLLNICHDYCELHDLTINAKKSICMYFSIDINKHCGLPVMYRGNSQGRIGPAAPPPLRAVGPWLNHAFFYELICCEIYIFELPPKRAIICNLAP